MTGREPGANSRRDVRRVLLWGFLILVMVGVSALGMRSILQPRLQRLFSSAGIQPHLPVYGTVPDFALVERSAHIVRRADLAGKIWVTNLFLTRCEEECPLDTAEMARLQADVAQMTDVRLVSITVDPQHDTPAVLSQYADRFQADPARWLFLTGDKKALYHLAQDGLHLGIFDPEEEVQRSPDGRRPAQFSALEHRDTPSPVQTRRPASTRTLPHWLPSIAPSPAFAGQGREPDIAHSTRFVLVDRRARIRGYYDSHDETALQRLRQYLRSLLQEP